MLVTLNLSVFVWTVMDLSGSYSCMSVNSDLSPVNSDLSSVTSGLSSMNNNLSSLSVGRVFCLSVCQSVSA